MREKIAITANENIEEEEILFKFYSINIQNYDQHEKLEKLFKYYE